MSGKSKGKGPTQEELATSARFKRILDNNKSARREIEDDIVRANFWIMIIGNLSTCSFC